MKRFACIVAVLSIGLVAPVALAHPGHGQGGGFGVGVLHPISGLDHVFAMVAVGLLASQQARVVKWLLPAMFTSLLVTGGLVALGGATFPLAEQMIAASVLVLGILLALSTRIPAVIPALLVILFALFHGYAHGAEMPVGASAARYVLGFALGSMLLQGIGLALGTLLAQKRAARAVVSPVRSSRIMV